MSPELTNINGVRPHYSIAYYVPQHTDPYGLWTDVGGGLYKADYDGEYLDSLMQMVGHKYSTHYKYCIYPVKMKKEKQWPEKFCKGDVVDASYFSLTKWTKKFVGAIPEKGEGLSDYTYAAADFYGVAEANITHAPKVMADLIRTAAGHGATPLKRMVLIGHGPSAKLSNIFGAEDIKVADQADVHSFEHARAKKGPYWCWFAPNAEIRLVSCGGALLQRPSFASLLSPQGTVFGTTVLVFAQYENKKKRERPQMVLRGNTYRKGTRGDLEKFEANKNAWAAMKGLQ